MVGQEVPSATPDTLTSFIGDTATLDRVAFLQKYCQPVLVALTWRLDRREDEGSTSERVVAQDPNVEVGLASSVWKVRKRQRQNPDTFWVGRSRHNDVILNLADVSKVHAYFSRGEGQWFLTDLESRNGTRVDELDLPPLSTHPLRSGQVIRIGATARFLFLDGAGLWDLLERVRKTS